MSERPMPPRDFLWGVAASAYQIEGAVNEDGRGRSIWDDFCHTPGTVEAGDTGDVACDHYHRYPEDIALMADLGVNAYRFSIAWPRVEPDGDGRPNPKGVAFYDRLVDALLERGIEPLSTLYHWDLPSALEARGGWRSRDTAARFAAYAERMTAALGDRVGLWITHNEPWCAAQLGHAAGEHAPGMRNALAATRVAHHLLLSHGLAYDAMKALRPNVTVGVALNLPPFDAPDDAAENLAAARLADGLQNRWYLDPLLRGTYPEDVRAYLARRGAWPDLDLADLARVGGRCDFLGVNYYNPVHVRAGDGGPDPDVVEVPQRPPLTEMGWEVEPDGLRRILVRLATDYPGVPLYITENGAAYPDAPGAAGAIHDPDRIDYLKRHVAAMQGAMAAGVPVRGFFYWSLLDNFEWAFGYSKRFGLVAMGPSLERQPKDSFYTYRDLIAAARSGTVMR